jgi:DNA (cytosine-5)-methyltransferase 1
MSKLTVGSLFAGIGGFDLGLERAGMEVRWQVEIDEFCSAVLAKHWPEVKRYEDVQKVHARNVRNCYRPPCRNCLEPVDVLAGGFPCQDISFAGPGDGLEGDRSGLWHQYARLIGEVRPRYVIVENVAALLVRGFSDVLSGLARIRYDAQWSIVSACSVGTPHVRRRLFIVAYPNSVDGWPRVRDSVAQAFRSVQAIGGFESARVGYRERLADPSALYRDADGVPDRGEWRAVDPWWIRGVSIDLALVPCEVPMPEGKYPAVAKVERCTWKRPRWFGRTEIRAWLDIPKGIPHAGKGENSWDCGDDGLFGIGGASIDDAIENARRSVLRSRERYGNASDDTMREALA